MIIFRTSLTFIFFNIKEMPVINDIIPNNILKYINHNGLPIGERIFGFITRE